MAEKRKILIQIDSDPFPSLFDRIVALDAGAEEVISYGGVQVEHVRDLIHGAIFTRGPKDLASTAIFIGGKDVSLGEQLLAEACRLMIPNYGLQVSIMLDANGANTTAVAAVHCLSKQFTLSQARAAVLGAGPVGMRVAQLLLLQGARVALIDPQPRRLQQAVERCVGDVVARLQPLVLETNQPVVDLLQGSELLISAGPTGQAIISDESWQQIDGLRFAVDLNAVPPPGLAGLSVMDADQQRGLVKCFGALHIGQIKMKCHKLAIQQLFKTNRLILDLESLWDGFNSNRPTS